MGEHGAWSMEREGRRETRNSDSLVAWKTRGMSGRKARIIVIVSSVARVGGLSVRCVVAQRRS